MKKDLAWKDLLKMMLRIFLTSLFVLGQEAVFCFLFIMLHQPIINYTDIEATFEENHPPVLAFANTETAACSDT